MLNIEESHRIDERFLLRLQSIELYVNIEPLVNTFSGSKYLLSSLGSLFVTRADRIVLWVTLAYAREFMIQHYAYAPVTKRDPRELSRYSDDCVFFEIA